MQMSKKHQDRLEDIKDKIRASHDYFRDNVTRYHEFVNFVFNSSLVPNEIDKLQVLQKPALEFNILEAMVSRLRGEFSKQEPCIDARAADGVPLEKLTPEFMKTIDVIESHLREIFFDGDNDLLENRVYLDLLAGGFSVAEVYTDYINVFSFEQRIFVERVFDVTLTGFDPLARDSHKGDGAYCFQMIPKNREEFEEEFGKDATKDMKFTNASEGGGGSESSFQWSYKNQQQDIVLVVDFYEKHKVKKKIVKLSNGHVMIKKDYDRFITLWEESGVLEQAPIIIEERWTEVENIERYRICGQKVLDHTVTNFKHLPLVFIDGNSVIIRKDDTSSSSQMCRPYVYHAKGIQQLKNFSGQTLANEIENMNMNMWVVAAEAIPEAYKDAYINPQQGGNIVYNAFYKDDPSQPLPPPREVQRIMTPPIVEQTFLGSDQVTQTILGSYDGALAMNGSQLSGVAIQQGALQSNAAALPYLMGYIAGMNRIAQIIVDLIPKFYLTPRSIPVRGIDGKRSYKVINTQEVPEGEDALFMGYDSNDLEIRVAAGPNSAIQKQVALDQISRMMQSSQLFAEFINTKGLETIVDNLDIRGADQMKASAAEFMKEQLAKQQQSEKMQQQQAGMPDPMVELGNKDIDMRHQTAMADIQIKKEKAETERLKDMGTLALNRQKANQDFIKIMAQIKLEHSRHQREIISQEQEIDRAAFDMALGSLAKESPMEMPMPQQMPQPQDEEM